MAVISPSQHQTISQLRVSVESGAVSRYNAVIIGVRVKGADIGDAIPQASAGDIVYDVAITDRHAGIDPASLTGLVPDNRRASNVLVVGPRRWEPCTIVVSRIEQPTRVYFFPERESTDLLDCHGNPVLEVD